MLERLHDVQSAASLSPSSFDNTIQSAFSANTVYSANTHYFTGGEAEAQRS